jgi:hypothetical protein
MMNDAGTRPGKETPDERRRRLMEELRREAAARAASYRARALQILPHICASCGRSFEGKRLRELTVHHKDHNFRNNPPDGSNWELLCIYCHDHEHEKELTAKTLARGDTRPSPASSGLGNPFSALDSLLSPPADGSHSSQPPKE